MATTVYNVFNGDDCAFESLTKEQIYDLIANSIQQGELVGVDADNPFVTKIKEQNKGAALKFWVGTQAEFNAIQAKEQNCFYIISDSTAQEDIENTLDELQTSVNGLLENSTDYAFASNYSRLNMIINWMNIGAASNNFSIKFDLTDKTDLVFYAFNEYGWGYMMYDTSVSPPQLFPIDNISDLINFEATSDGGMRVKSISPSAVFVTFAKKGATFA